MNEKLLLYSYFRSSTSYRVRIALNLKNISYQQKNIHLLEGGGQQNQSEYRAINPAGEVPSIEHKGKIISQSFAIIEYLDEVFPEPKLFPVNSYERAKIRQICEHINCGMHPINNLKVQQYLTQHFKISDTEKNQWIQYWNIEGFNALEKIVKETSGKFTFGDSITAADLFVIPQIFSGIRFGLDLKNYPLLEKITTQCLQIEAFQLAHPHVQPDTPEELRGKF